MRDTISLNGTWDFMPLYQQHVSGLPEEISLCAGAGTGAILVAAVEPGIPDRKIWI